MLKTFSFTRTAVAGVAALTLAGATLGVVGAQQTPSPSPSPVPGATRPNTLGQPPADKQQRHQEYTNAVAANLGVTPDRLEQAMQQARTQLGIPERGPGGPGGPHGRGMHFDAAATAIGITPDQLRTELQGKSLADVARARNVDPTTVATALKSAANTRIDEAAAAGRIPSGEVAQAKTRAAQRIDEMMTRTGPPERPAGGIGPLPTGAPGSQGR